MTLASQTHSFGLGGNDETRKQDPKNQGTQKDRWKRDSNQSRNRKDANFYPVTTTSEDENPTEHTDRKSHELPAPSEQELHEVLKLTDRKFYEVLESANPKFHEALESPDLKFHDPLESTEPEFHETMLGSASSERFIAEHNYGGAETFDKNLTWAFTQPCSSHVRQIREIQRCLHDKRANSGWNYSNPMMRYVELCSDDSTRCSADIEEVLEKYFKVSSLTTNSTIQRNPAKRCKVSEPMEIEEVIFESIDDVDGAVDEDLVSVNVAMCEECAETGNGSQRPEKKISLLGVHFLQDKKLLLLKTSHSVRKTAHERYQHLTKAFRLPGKMTGSNLGLGGSCRRISRFLNDECWTEATGRRETCIVTQNISRTNHFVDAPVNSSEISRNKQNDRSSNRNTSANRKEESQND